jgi:hypothetical protein
MTLLPALLALLLTGIAFGQDAQFSGMIQDPSEAAVAGAEITLRSDQNGARRTTRSSEDGLYNLTTLKPGTYRMTVRAAGFETIVREGIELQIGENARLDFTLHIGDSQTTITVTSGNPSVNQDDASVGTVIDRNLIDRLPLNGRGIQTLMELTPGVVAMPVIDASRGQFVINGQRTDANYFTVDGVSADFAAGDSSGVNSRYRLESVPTFGQAGGGMLPANNFLGTFSNLLSPEALQEFKIQTSTYAPESGHLPGGQIDLISRSGGSRFAGSLFEYFRNDKTDANDWFQNAAGAPRDPLRFNNFGITFSGPLRLPSIYNGDGRSFFFLSIDELIARQPLAPVQVSVPSLASRRSAPPSLAALLNAYPFPTSGSASSDGLALYDGAATRSYDQHAISLRVDHYFGQGVSFFARYNHAPSRRAEPLPLGTPSNFEHYDIGTDTLTGGLTQVIAPNLVNEIRGNFSRQSTEDKADLDGSTGAVQPPQSLLFPPGYSLSNSVFQFSVLAAPFVYLGTYARNSARQFQVVDNLSWVKGAHRFRFGADYRRFYIRRMNSKLGNFTALGIYNDDGSFATNSSGWLTAIDFDSDIEYLVPSFSAYAQDTWRLSRRLALTWGLRWEVEPAPRTTRGMALAVGGLTNLNDATNTYLLPPGRPFYPTSWTNLAPRIGIGWQLFEIAGKPTVLRAGFGRFFSSAQAGFEDNGRNHVILADYGNRPLGQQPDLQNPIDTQTIDNSIAVGAPRGYNLPSIYQWNVTLEQAIGQQTISIGYVAALGRGLIGDIAYLPTYAAYSVHVIGNNASSSYNSMQVQMNRRLASRLQILASYTWSHSIDNLSNDLSPSGIQRTLPEYLNPDSNRGPSDFDLRHSVSGAVIVELPGPRGHGLATLLQNWRANTIFFARSPLPGDVIALLPEDHIVRVADQPLYLYGSQYPGGKRYNPDAFVEVGGDQKGNLGRNTLRGFDAWQVDFALHRQIRIAENVSMEFRAEVFNVLNHPNFANPTDTGYLNSVLLNHTPQFGVATAMLANGLSSALIPGELNPLFQVGGPRIMQFALRLNF